MIDIPGEKALVERAAKGDPQAQRQLFNKFSVDLMKLCIFLVGDREEAKEVLSDAFRKCLRHLKHVEYRNEPAFKSWIKKIVVTTARMHNRKKGIDYEDLPPDFEVSLNPSVLDELALQDIMAHIDQLEVSQREAFTHHYVLGYGISEIAAVLAISENTVKWHLKKAKLELQKKLSYYKINII